MDKSRRIVQPLRTVRMSEIVWIVVWGKNGKENTVKALLDTL